MPISVSHLKTVTIADQTNTAIVRPSDWNSAHSVVFSPEGNELLPAFSNAGNVTFGTNAQSKITAAVALAAGLALSAGTQSANSGTLAFANSNGISFGMSGSSQITASHNGLTTAALSNHSHGNPSLALTNLSGTTASNSAGVTFSLSAGNYLTTAALSNHSHGFSASGGSSAFQTLNFANSNGITFSNSNGSVIASHNGLTTAAQSNHSHGNPSLALTNLSGTTASNSAGLTLSISAGNYLTTAAQSNHSHGNPTLNLTNLSGTTASNSAGFTLSLSAAAGGGGADGYNILAAGTQTATTAGTVRFENSNGISFGMSGSTQITASHNGLTTAAQSNHSHGVTLNLTNINGTTGGNSNGINLSLSAVVPAQTVQTQGMVSLNGQTGALSLGVASSLSSSVNGVSTTFGLASNITTALQSAGAYLTTAAQSGHSHGNPTLNLTNINGTTASNSAGLTLSLSAVVPAQTVQTQNMVSVLGSTGNISFANSNGITFGGNASTITASHNGLTTAALSNHSHAFSASGGSSAFQTLSFSAQNGVSFTNTNGQVGVVHALQYTSNTSAITANAAHSTHSHGNPTLNLTNLSGTTASNSAGFTLSLSAAGGGGGGADGYNILAAGTQTAGTATTVNFANSNGISFGMSGSSQITASHNALTTAALSNHSHGNPTLELTNISGTTASNSGGLTLSLIGNPLRVNSFFMDGNTAGTVNSFTANNAIVNYYGGPNITIQHTAPGGFKALHIKAGLNVSAGSTSNNVESLHFVNSNGVSFGMNGSTITASAAGGGGGGFTKTFWYPYNEAVNVAGIHGQASMVFNPIPLDDPLSVDRLCVPLYFSNASNSVGTLSFSLYWGAYTKNAGTLSSVASISTLVTMAYASNNSSASQRGIRLLTIPLGTTLPQDRYFVGVGIRTSGAGNNCTFSQILVSQLNSNYSGLWNAASANSDQWPIGVGYYSASTTGVPASVAFSQLRGTNSLCARPPSWHMVNSTV